MITYDVNRIPLSIPAPGRTIQSLAGSWETHTIKVFKRLINSAKKLGLEDEIIDKYRKTFVPVIPSLDKDRISQLTLKEVELASAAVISIWMLAKYNLKPHEYLSYEEAEAWFLGKFSNVGLGLAIDRWITREIFLELETQDYGRGFFELLPYIFELIQTHNHNNVEESISTEREKQKRKGGVFFTPSDLADYIVQEVGTDWESKEAFDVSGRRWLDPACGTGVFFIAILNWVKRHDVGKILTFASESLYGIDISPQAIQACAFVITNYILRETEAAYSPWQIWQLIRGNLAIYDSTMIGGVSSSSSISEWRMRARIEKKARLLNCCSQGVIKYLTDDQTPPSLSTLDSLDLGLNYQYLVDIFPECKEGFDFLVGNPPYSVEQDVRYRNIRDFFYESSRLDKEGNIYTLFVEMMWKFTRKEDSKAGLVIPLSIAYNTNDCFRTIRSEIEKAHAKFRFTFFDRTPDSLFGDAVKTRNSTVIMQKKSYQQTLIETGPIVRWNSRNRNTLFLSLKHVQLDQISLREFIPKLGSDLEKQVYTTLKSRHDKLGLMWDGNSFKNFYVHEQQRNDVYFYIVAYNWLSVFREFPRDDLGQLSISSSLRGLSCKNNDEADFVFAILSSRLVYWLWRVEGDGFHLNLKFLNNIPINISRLSTCSINKLQDISRELWRNLLKNPIVSFNANRRTINYSPEYSGDFIDEIDKAIIHELGLSENFITYLKQFVIENIIVGRQEEFQMKGRFSGYTNKSNR